jgi:hypothetical protein
VLEELVLNRLKLITKFGFGSTPSFEIICVDDGYLP